MKVGDYLKKIREEKNITIDAISHKTKINTKSLAALENNNFDQLPNKIYIIAYVKNYCSSINIDSKEALELLNAELQEENTSTEDDLILNHIPGSSNHEPNEALTLLINKVSNKKLIYSLIFLVVFISVIVKVKNIVDHQLPPTTPIVTSAPVEDVITETEKETLSQVIEKTAAKEEPKVEVVVEVKKEEPKKEVVKEVKKEEPKKEVIKEVKKEEPKKEVKLTDELKKELLKYQAIKNPMYVLSADNEDLNDPDIYPKEYKNKVDPKKQNVFINALFSDVWLRYKLDDNPVRQNTIKQGKKLFLQADNTILVFIGNFFATKVIYNNNYVSGKAPAGVKSLVFPHAIRTNYYLPLFTKGTNGRAITSKKFVEANSN